MNAPLRTLSNSGSVDGSSGGGAAPKFNSAGKSASSRLLSSSTESGGAEGARDSTTVSDPIAGAEEASATKITDKQPVNRFGDRHAKVKGTTVPFYKSKTMREMTNKLPHLGVQQSFLKQVKLLIKYSTTPREEFPDTKQQFAWSDHTEISQIDIPFSTPTQAKYEFSNNPTAVERSNLQEVFSLDRRQKPFLLSFIRSSTADLRN
jgi:hypothetical protein